MPTPKSLYAKALNEITKRYGRLDHQTVRRLIELLQETRKSIALQLLQSPTDFEIFRLSQLRDNIDIIVKRFQIQFGDSLTKALVDAHSLGTSGVVDPLNAIGLNVGTFNTIPTAQLNVVLDFSAELVQNIGDDLRKTINTQLRLSTLAQQTPFQAMKNVTDALGVKSRDGVWGRRTRPEVVRGVAARAETVVRTEMTRIFNLAQSSQQQQAAQTVPELRKRWVATGDGRTRDSHLRAHRRYNRNPIPVDETFIVGGAKLMFPGDPRGPASETINCRCTTVMVHPDVGVIGTPLDDRIDTEIKQRDKQKA